MAEHIAWALGAGFVFTLALLIIALGCIDELRDELARERAFRAAQLRFVITSRFAARDVETTAREIERSLKNGPFA